MFDVMTMLSDTALTEQLLSCQESKIEFIIQQVICCFTVVRSLLFLTGEWIGLLRPRLDLEKARPWPWGCLALASNWSGLGLEHSVLESIPATTWCQRHSSHTVKATALRRLWRRSTMTCCLLQTLANWPNWSNCQIDLISQTLSTMTYYSFDWNGNSVSEESRSTGFSPTSAPRHFGTKL